MKKDIGNKMKKVIVIGGGAAGMMAAVTAAQKGCQVILYEKNDKLGKKIFITGKGRCNLTNACDIEGLFENVVTNSKFLYSAFYGFDNQAVMAWFEDAGCPLKIERGERVFPVSDHSSDVISALSRQMKKWKVAVQLNTAVEALWTETAKRPDADREEVGNIDRQKVGSIDRQEAASTDGEAARKTNKDVAEKIERIVGVQLSDGRKEKADAVILATGGVSYPLTGSTGDGYRMAEATGHTIKETCPALVPFVIKEEWCKLLQGLSLKNVTVALTQNGKKPFYEGFGEMLFTHFGVSGPLILSASSYYVGRKKKENTVLHLDLKPALSIEQLDKRLLRDFEENKNKQFKNSLGGLFPAKLIPVMISLSGIDGEKKVNEITKEERSHFIQLIKNLEMTVTGTRGYAEAIITRGGVNLKEVNPSTMESKLVQGLYFAGELLDLDALTGGFNLQIAWSTGYQAGAAAAENTIR